MAMMAERGFRHLPVLDAGTVVGAISIGDVVAQRGQPDGLHHEGRPRGLTDDRGVPRVCLLVAPLPTLPRPATVRALDLAVDVYQIACGVYGSA